MNTRFSDVWDRLGHRCLSAQLALQDTVDSLAATPRQRRWLCLGSMLGVGAMHFASATPGDGIAGMVTTAADQGTTIKTQLGRLFAAGGFGAAGYGGYNWWRKGKEGEQSHIKAGQIFVPLLAGAVLGATSFVMIKAGESVGISSTDLGSVPS